MFINDSGLGWVRNNKIDKTPIITTAKKGVQPDITVYYKNVL